MEGLPIEPRYCPHQYPDGRRKEERTTVGTRRRKKGMNPANGHEPAVLFDPVNQVLSSIVTRSFSD